MNGVFYLLVTLDEALQGQVRAAELLHLRQLLLDSIVDLVAALFSGIRDLKNLRMVLTPVVFNSPSRSKDCFILMSGRL